MMNNKALIAISSILIIFGFLYGVYAFTNKPAQLDFPEVTTVANNDNIKWAPKSKNVLVEYSDLQCPACKAFHENIKSTMESDKEITDNVTFVYRHFPLDNIHANARAAAYAAEAAGKQKKFFEYADKLFATQETWAQSDKHRDLFIQYAKEIGLDAVKFETDMDSKEVKEEVQNDFISGNNAQVDATPTFYLNGKKLTNLNSFEDLKKILKETAQTGK